MPRRTIIVLLCSSIFCWLGTAPALSQEISVVINGRPVYFDQNPAMIAGRLMVPLRAIFEALEADVIFDAPTKTIKATRGYTVVELTLGSRKALINGRPVYLDVPAGTLQGRTMVPLRFVSEALGAEVKWKGSIKTVFIDTDSDTNQTAGDTWDDNGSQSSSTGPKTKKGVTKPYLDSVIHDGLSPLHPGDTLKVILTGDPGCQAGFELVGVTDLIPLYEVRPGRYEGSYTVTPGIGNKRVMVLGHLIRRGVETVKEASRPVVLRAELTFDLWPKPGTTIQDMRPRVRVITPFKIRKPSVRLFVDGTDYTRMASITDEGVYWRPSWDLDMGNHKVKITGVTANGKSFEKTWSFTVSTTESRSPIERYFPAQGTTTESLRPRIGVRLRRAYVFNMIRLIVDGKDFSRNITRQGRDYIWIPEYDLSPGFHRARIEILDAQKRNLVREWEFKLTASRQLPVITDFTYLPHTTLRPGQEVTFTVSGTAGREVWLTVWNAPAIKVPEGSPGVYKITLTVPASISASTQRAVVKMKTDQGTWVRRSITLKISRGLNNPSTSVISVTNLRAGMTLPPVFNVQGVALPGAQVTVMVEYRKPTLGGVITELKRIRVAGTADGRGHFDLVVNASPVPSGTKMLITVSSQGKSKQIEVKRR